MKNLILFVCSLFLGFSAFAGSANCSGITHVSGSPSSYYHVALSACVLSVERASYFDMEFIFPNSGLSLNDEYTIVDATSFDYDHCEEGYCHPGTVSLLVENDAFPISGVNEIANTGLYEEGYPYRYTMKIAYNGSDYDLVDFYSPTGIIPLKFFVHINGGNKRLVIHYKRDF